jgi:hypothetical protein
MHALSKSTTVEAKLFMREPLTVAFTLALPLLFLFVMGGVTGPCPLRGGALASLAATADSRRRQSQRNRSRALSVVARMKAAITAVSVRLQDRPSQGSCSSRSM